MQTICGLFVGLVLLLGLTGARALVQQTVTRDTPLGVYLVAPGDSLSLIAGRYGVSVAQLQAVNTLPDPRHRLPPAASRKGLQ